MSGALIALLTGAAVPPPSGGATRALSWGTEPINLVIDGNSHYQWAGLYAIQQRAPLSSLGATSTTNVAIAGQDWRNMQMDPSDAIAAYDPAKTNIYLIGETSNDIFGGNAGRQVSTDQCLADARMYLATLRAGLPGPAHVVLCGTIPRGGRPEDAALNASAQAADAYMAAHYADDFGAVGYVDYRGMAPTWFGGDGTTRAGFMASGDTCYEAQSGGSLYAASGPWIHPYGTAQDAFAQCIADTLRAVRIPA